MGVLDKDYKITVDIRSGEITSDDIIFASKDQNVSNINVQFVKNNEPVNITGFVFVANIQMPDTLKTPFEISIVDAKNGLGKMDLPLGLTMDVGVYNVEIEMAKDDEISHTYTFSYMIRETLCGDIDDSLVEDSNYNILIKLVKDVRQLEMDITRNEDIRVRKENERISQETLRQSQETQRQKNDVDRDTKTNDKLTVMDNKVVEVETRFNQLTASQQQSSEVIDARRGQDGVVYNSLRERLIALENNPYVLFETVEG
ncbi:MAG: BppU family phage baseplate upper protein [Cetobacterium sp.]